MSLQTICLWPTFNTWNQLQHVRVDSLWDQSTKSVKTSTNRSMLPGVLRAMLRAEAGKYVLQCPSAVQHPHLWWQKIKNGCVTGSTFRLQCSTARSNKSVKQVWLSHFKWPNFKSVLEDERTELWTMCFSTSQLIGSISCSLHCTLPNEAETTWSDKTKMHQDRLSSSNATHIGKVSLTHLTAPLQNEWTAGSKSCRQTEPIQSSLPPRSWPVSGRALVPERQMVMKWWPIMSHPIEKAVLCQKRRLGILLFAVLKLFLETFPRPDIVLSIQRCSIQFGVRMHLWGRVTETSILKASDWKRQEPTRLFSLVIHLRLPPHVNKYPYYTTLIQL